MLIDIEALRAAFMDRAGTAAFNGFPWAMGDVVALEDATPEELVAEAERQGLNLTRFEAGS